MPRCLLWLFDRQEHSSTKVTQSWQRSEIRARRKDKVDYGNRKDQLVWWAYCPPFQRSTPCATAGNWQRQSQERYIQTRGIISQGIIDSSTYTRIHTWASHKYAIIQRVCTNTHTHKLIYIRSCTMQNHRRHILSKKLSTIGSVRFSIPSWLLRQPTISRVCLYDPPSLPLSHDATANGSCLYVLLTADDPRMYV